MERIFIAGALLLLGVVFWHNYVFTQKVNNEVITSTDLSVPNEEDRFCGLEVIQCADIIISDSPQEMVVNDEVRQVVVASVSDDIGGNDDGQSVEYVKESIRILAREYGVNEETALRIANCESGPTGEA